MPESAALYTLPPQTLKTDLTALINRISRQHPSPVPVFFRADDIGIPSANFQRLIALFLRHKIPLCLATVPSWLNGERLEELYRITGKTSSQWCWHQHGYLHRNYETEGKKQEFGPARPEKDIKNDIKRGKERLESLLGKEFQPFFTPPWNRCSAETIAILADLGFKALSRSRGASPETIAALPDLQVNVDLHTRKEETAVSGFANLSEELESSITAGRCGIMIHHGRMNSKAFDFLDILLENIAKSPALIPVLFDDLPGT